MVEEMIIKQFYESEKGMHIMNPKFWPEKILGYLRKEEHYIANTNRNRHKNNDAIILDIGCGEGRYVTQLSKYCRNISGIDHSKSMVMSCKKNISGVKNANILLADIKTVKYPKKYFDDILCMFNTFGNMDHNAQNAVLKNADVSLKDGGTLYLSVYSENAVKTQIAFYKNIGLKVLSHDEDFVYTNEMKFERFSKEKMHRIIADTPLAISKVYVPNDISYIFELTKK